MTKPQVEELYNQCKPQVEAILKLFVKDLKTRLVNLPVGITYKFRIKEFNSFYEKWAKRSVERLLPLHNIRDLMAVRLICPFQEDIDLVDDYLQHLYKVKEVDRKGAERSFKEFGYSSTHLEIELEESYGLDPDGKPFYCEVQVRTILQDAWAEVEHELIYKNKFALNDVELKHKMAALNANLTLSDIIFQEIRSYQKQLRSKMDMRQSRLQQQIDEMLTNDHPFLENKMPSLAERPDALLMEAISAHDSGRYQKAIDLYTKILENDLAENVKLVVLANRGMVYLSCQMCDQAEEDFTKANQIQSTANACYYLGVLSLLKKDYTKAVTLFSQSLALNKDQSQSHLGRARAYFKLGQKTAAIKDCDAALALSPDLETAINFKQLVAQHL